ncbi:MAG: methylated-DNA--[protein]-cysteine S-methyltransferase [Desulfobaccales bacterium]
MRRTKREQARELTVSLADTPLGGIILYFTPKGLAALDFAGEAGEIDLERASIAETVDPMIGSVVKELRAFLAGAPADFRDLPLDLQGTPFQLRVWQELRRIPWGGTISYRELARRAGSPKALRAVGQANAVNPIPIIIPCHRVISADGSLGGYSSGLWRKCWLLKHEGVRQKGCR